MYIFSEMTTKIATFKNVFYIKLTFIKVYLDAELVLQVYFTVWYHHKLWTLSS